MFEKIMSVLPMVLSIYSILSGRSDKKENKIFREKVFDYDVQKEKTRQQEKRIEELFTRLGSRSPFIPFFSIIVKDSFIKLIKEKDKKKIILKIELINIGKEAATNIMLKSYEQDFNSYFKSDYTSENDYFVYDYLDKSFAMSKGKISFSLVKEIDIHCDYTISDFLLFKIQFCDLLGNLYTQEFRFGYICSMKKIVFSRDHFSYVPELINDNLVEKE